MTHQPTAEGPTTVELPTDPFEGLDVYSTAEDLALAEVWQRLTETQQEPGGLERRLLAYQLEATANSLGEYYPGYPTYNGEGLTERLKRKKTELERQGISSVDLEVPFIIGSQANQARWRLVGIDPSTLSQTARINMEGSWGEAAHALRLAKLAELEAEIARLEAENQLSTISTGQQLEGWAERRARLFKEMHHLKRPSII